MRQLLFAALASALVSGCNSGPDCVIDTDCPLGQYCADEACVAIERDAGVSDAGDGEVDDAGPTDAEVDAPTVDAGPTVVGFGSVRATSQADGHTLTASFTLAAGGAGCTETVMGPCRVTTCPPPMMVEDAGMPDAGTMDAGPPAAAPNTGTINFGGSIIPAIDLVPDPESGLYPVTTGATPLWEESMVVMVTSPGDDVPAVSVNLSGTAAVTVTAPTAAAVPAASDLTVSWSGVSPGDVVVSLIAFGRPETNPSAECRFMPSAASGDVPAGVLAALGAGSALFSVRSESRNQTDRLGWQVSVALVTPAQFDPSVPATLTLE